MRGVRQLPHSPHGPPCLTNMHWLESELQKIIFPILNSPACLEINDDLLRNFKQTAAKT